MIFWIKNRSKSVSIWILYSLKKYYAMQVLTKAYTTLPYGIPAATGPKLAGDLLDAITDLSYSTLTYGGGNFCITLGHIVREKKAISRNIFLITPVLGMVSVMDG